MSHAIFMNLSKYQMRRIEYLDTDRFKDTDTNTCAYLSWIFLKTRPSTIRFHLPQQDIDGAVIDPFSGVLSSDDKLKERLTACFLYIEEYRMLTWIWTLSQKCSSLQYTSSVSFLQLLQRGNGVVKETILDIF